MFPDALFRSMFISINIKSFAIIISVKLCIRTPLWFAACGSES